jgi:hydroxyacylglutathione hydrolase
MEKTRAITLPLPFRLGAVNCYLVDIGAGFVLIDTGASNQRDRLERELATAGCNPGNLRLILLTHGDFDHTGNAAYLRRKFGCPIAMHPADAGMAEHADMFWNRSSGNAILRFLAPLLFRFPRANRFTPDLDAGEGFDLAPYDLEARILSIPGHSAGSIGILTAGGDLFCGDLLDNTRQPVINTIMDDSAACRASLDKLQGLTINTVYPGHGRPFPMTAFLAGRQEGSQGQG